MNRMNKTIIITGGAGRIGSTLATALVKLGHNVLLGDIDRSKLLKIKKRLNSANVEIFSGDLTFKSNIIGYGMTFTLSPLLKLRFGFETHKVMHIF